jgi:hypothetical protein
LVLRESWGKRSSRQEKKKSITYTHFHHGTQR